MTHLSMKIVITEYKYNYKELLAGAKQYKWTKMR